MNDVSTRQGLDGATPPISLATPAVLRRRSMVLITGGSGFVGANLADRLAAGGERVLIYDNLSRPNVVANLEWLQQRHGHRIETAIADVRDADALREAMLRLSALLDVCPEIREIDLNPLKVMEHGVSAIDARIRVEPIVTGAASRRIAY